jgi:predicted dehydrogenase
MSEKKGKTLSRKNFLKNSSLGVAGAALGAGMLKGSGKSSTKVLEVPNKKNKFAANDHIQIASIGMGIRAHYELPAALKVPGVQLVAAADCYDSRLVHAKEVFGKDILTTKDYREILVSDDIDAVIVPVPDHWHKKISIDAMKAGKDVYCEKPMVHKLEEGKEIIKAQKQTGRKFQVGSQYASSILFHKAREMYQAGLIGRLEHVDVAYNRNTATGAWEYSIPQDATPETVDWDTFLGDAPKMPWNPKRFFRWRCYRDYGEGISGDLFVHLLTGTHTVTGRKGPTLISGMGGLDYWHDGRNVPDNIYGQYVYPKTNEQAGFILNLKSNLADGGGGSNNHFRFVGTQGTIEVGLGTTIKLTQHHIRKPTLHQLVHGYNSVQTFSKKVQQEFIKDYKKAHANSKPQSSKMDHTTIYHAPKGYDSTVSHMMNFFDSVRNGVPVFENAVFGFRAAAPALLTNKSYHEKRLMKWDPVKMKVVD